MEPTNTFEITRNNWKYRKKKMHAKLTDVFKNLPTHIHIIPPRVRSISVVSQASTILSLSEDITYMKQRIQMLQESKPYKKEYTKRLRNLLQLDTSTQIQNRIAEISQYRLLAAHHEKQLLKHGIADRVDKPAKTSQRRKQKSV